MRIVLRAHPPRSFAFALLVGAAFALHAGSASGAEPGIELRVDAPSSCTDADRLRAAIDGIRGPGRPGTRAPFAADVEITGSEGDFRMVISIHAAGAPTREVVDPDCHHLAEAAAVILALAIDDAEQRARETEAPPKTAPPVPAAPRARPVAPPGAGSRRATPAHVALSAAGLLDVAALPAPTPGVAAGVTIARGDWRGEATFIALASAAAEIGGGPAGGDISLMAGALRGCWTPLHAGILAAGPCAGIEAGAAHGVGFGVDQPGENTQPWVAPRAGLLAQVPLGSRLTLAASADALFPVIRAHFRLGGVGEVHQAPPVTGRFSLGLEIRLW